MKRSILSTFILFIIFSTQAVFAQFSRPISVGAGAGGTMVWADLGNTDTRLTSYAEADWLVTPFISVGARGEHGRLSAWGYNSSFKNKHWTVQANAKVRLGQFLPLPDNYSYYTLGASTFSKILANIYVGVGVGGMKNNISHGNSLSGSNNIAPSHQENIESQGGEVLQGDDLKSWELAVPLHIGVDIPIGRTLYGPRWAININYQQSFLPNDNVDGIINNRIDQYSYLSVGVKYALFNRN